MNQIFLIPFIFFILLTTAHAEQIYRCVDSDGNDFITTSPQDGMKCVAGESKEEQSSPSPKASKVQDKSSQNVLDTCENLYRESEEINDEIKSFDFRLSELQKKQFDIRQRNVENKRSQRVESEETKPLRDEQYKINQRVSLLYQKKSLISNDIRRYKCDQIKQDLSRINQGSSINNAKDSSPGSRKSTLIMRKKGSTVIIRN